MTQQAFLSASDTLLLTLPLLAMMFLGVFGVDQLVAAPRHPQRSRRPQCGVDAQGRQILCDPDGRPSNPPKVGSRRARVIDAAAFSPAVKPRH